MTGICFIGNVFAVEAALQFVSVSGHRPARIPADTVVIRVIKSEI